MTHDKVYKGSLVNAVAAQDKYLTRARIFVNEAESAKVANTPLMKRVDLAIITGMTLPNRTLPGLLKLAKRYNTSTMIWAITRTSAAILQSAASTASYQTPLLSYPCRGHSA